jgi:hypothetical protein
MRLPVGRDCEIQNKEFKRSKRRIFMQRIRFVDCGKY